MTSNLNLTTAFNDFLFATVCEDRNDMPLSVVSTLARLDLDPWDEASELARLPADGATQRLCSLLALVPDGLAIQPEREVIAARLVSLLPRPSISDAPFSPQAPRVTSVPHFGPILVMCLIMLASMTASLFLGTQAPGRGASIPAAAPAAGTSLTAKKAQP